ncbi:MAG: hypothetical protein QGF12_00390 [SAR202 cluster bacterium]|nr:hypothetical protein [SAR202 cluster bacterium]
MRATRCVETLGFEEFYLQRIRVRAGVSNARNLGVPNRLRFKFKDILCKADRVNDPLGDVAVYSVQKCEWEVSS